MEKAALKKKQKNNEVHSTFDFQQAVKRLLSTAPTDIHVSWYGSLYSDGVLIMEGAYRAVLWVVA